VSKRTDGTAEHPARTFEERLIELQEMVRRLDEDQLTLEDAVAAYEQAMEIANTCNQMLDAAELRITRIDEASSVAREEAVPYRLDSARSTMLFLGDDEDDLSDLLNDDE
jgi:exodeoxyribonuclease VII small subunit